MKKILVIEDDRIISQVISEFLTENQYFVKCVFDGLSGLEMVRCEEFDLVILDIMLPVMDGLTVLKEIRKFSNVNILMLTAVGDEYTQLVSFNNLISDYVIKPFSPLILMKRIENILRDVSDASEILIDNIIIKGGEGLVLVDKIPVSLTKIEFEILLYLAQKKGKVVPREVLMNAIWGYDDTYTRVLDNHMKNIRKKIPTLPIKTIVGRGYLLGE